LGACQNGLDQPEWEPIQAEESRIRFDHPDFLPELTEYAVRRWSHTGSESHIASFHGPETHGLVVALSPGPGYVVELTSTELLIGRLLPDSELLWADAGRAGQAGYRLFHMHGHPLSCVAFSQGAGNVGHGPDFKSSLIYGYFCRDELRPLTAESARELVVSVSG
jgi:hypothetical protein